jgi:transcriptional repressor NrdR
MNCPECRSPTRVRETRAADDGAAVRRRRQCPACGRRFTTFERAEPEPLFVIKRNGSRQPFNRAKLRAGLQRATHKRPVDPADVERLVDRIAAEVRAAGGELSSQRLGELCLQGLSELDAGAYLQFAGVDLADPEAIRAELGRLGRNGPSNGEENPANRAHSADRFRPGRVGSSLVPPESEREETE